MVGDIQEVDAKAKDLSKTQTKGKDDTKKGKKEKRTKDLKELVEKSKQLAQKLNDKRLKKAGNGIKKAEKLVAKYNQRIASAKTEKEKRQFGSNLSFLAKYVENLKKFEDQTKVNWEKWQKTMAEDEKIVAGKMEKRAQSKSK